MDNQEGWDKYQKLILKELRELRTGQERMNDEIIELKTTVADLGSTKEFVGEMKKHATLNQYEQIFKDVSMLKRFKNNALAVYTVLQIGLFLAMWYLDYRK